MVKCCGGGGLPRSNQSLSEARLKRLAKDIEALAEKDETSLRHSREIAALRRRAAAELFRFCSAFVSAVNTLLPPPEMELDPPAFSEESFQEDLANLMQINVRGRILQVEF